MRVILSGAAVLASLMAFGAQPAFAQSVAAVGGPAENPPAGFSGQQYVDSRGCVFMRAGFGGQVTWVPRIGRDRKPLCGTVTPSQAAARLAAGDSAAQPMTAGQSGGQSGGQSAGQDVGAPMETIASDMASPRKTGVFAPITVPGLQSAQGNTAQQSAQGNTAPRRVEQFQSPAPTYAAPQAASGAASGAVSVAAGCPATAPVLQTLPLNTGGTVTVCTRGDGTATGWVSPNYRSVGGAIRNVPGQQVGGVLGGAQVGGQVGGQAGGQGGAYVQTVIAGQQIVVQRPQGQTYKAAWSDDRLNPNRARGTAEGWAQQNQVWTQKVPAQTYSDIARKKAQRQAARQAAQQAAQQGAEGGVRMTASTMSSAGQTQATAGGRIYVQVGTFGQPANAQNAAGRLAGMGLPVASSKGVRGGQHLVSIMAGPFASAADANTALSMARSAGFADAFIR